MSSASDATSRWWEFYVVRYGMGTVVGAVIVFMLCKLSPTLAPMLFQAGKETNPTLDSATLVLLGVYGLAYCYLASAPILVFHAARHQMFVELPSKDRTLRLLVLTLASAIAVCVFPQPTSVETNTQWLLKLAIGIGSMVMLVQWHDVVSLLRKDGAQKNFDFYKTLTLQRNAEKTSIVESYRHLREHGNSFLIVVFELLLAFVMFAISRAYGHMTGLYLLTTVFLWVLPAALIWFVGSKLEHLFAHSPTAAIQTPASPSQPQSGT
ncbi:hypothetical protein [Hydrogenophaga soli]